MDSIMACLDMHMHSWNDVMGKRTLNAEEVAPVPL